MEQSKTLIVTVGGQAQVVTFALDWLLAQGEPIRQVIVVHPSADNPRVRQSLNQLALEFPSDQYVASQTPIRFRRIALSNSRGMLADIRDEAEAESTWQAMFALVADLKKQEQTLHLCLAGGRRVMGLMAMSAAMLLFDHRDRLWHLYTPDEMRRRANEGAIMHARAEEGVRLIQVPMVPWGAYFPGLQALVGLPSARVVADQQSWLAGDEQARCQRVVAQLSDRQMDVLRALANGLAPQQVAEQLGITLKTVDSHKTVILDLCRNEWQTPPGGRLDYHFLRDKFRGWFD